MERLVIPMIFIQVWLQGCQCQVYRKFQNGTSVLCKGITCPRNKIFETCTSINGNGRDDFCVPCPSARPISIESFDSAGFEEPPDGVCTDPKEKCTCSVEAKLINPDECFQTLNPVCNCKVEEGYYGSDPDLCQRTENNLCLEPGYQLSFDGQCLPCSEDRYKETEGYGLCIKQPLCPKNEEVDFQGNTVKRRTCKLHNIPGNVTNSVPLGVSPVPTHDHESNFTMKPEETIPVNSTIDKELTLGFGVGFGLLAVAVLFIVVICYRCRRKGVPRKKTKQKYIYRPVPAHNGTNDVNTRENVSQDNDTNNVGHTEEGNSPNHEDLQHIPGGTIPAGSLLHNSTVPAGSLLQNTTVPAGSLPQNTTVPAGSLSQNATVPGGSLPQNATVLGGSLPQNATVPVGSIPQNATIPGGSIPQNATVSGGSLPQNATGCVNGICDGNIQDHNISKHSKDVCIQIDDNDTRHVVENWDNSLGKRTEPDGAEKEAEVTYVKEVSGGYSHKTKPISQRNSKSLELNVSSLLSSGLPSSNLIDCICIKDVHDNGTVALSLVQAPFTRFVTELSNPSIQLRRVEEHVPYVPVHVSSIQQQTDSGIDSQMPTTGAAVLNNQPVLSLGDFSSDSGHPTNDAERR